MNKYEKPILEEEVIVIDDIIALSPTGQTNVDLVNVDSFQEVNG